MREIHKRRKRNFREVLLNHILDNLKFYIIVVIILIIGIVAGILFINNTNSEQITEIQGYINGFVKTLKEGNTIDKTALLKKSLGDNLILIVTMWFIGSTVIGIPIILGIVLFRGFCLGYTVSAIIGTMGVPNGILLTLSAVLLQNLIFIPAILCMAVSCIKLYKSIMKDKRRENIKIEIIRHTIISIVLFLALIVSSLIETYISSEIIMLTVKIL